MRLFTSNKRSSNNSSRRKTLSSWTLLTVLVLLSSFLAASAAPTGFCAECQTYAMVIEPCGGTFGPKDIEIDGLYTPPQSLAQCVCKAVIQTLLWSCARCESFGQFPGAKTDPPQKYQTMCKGWNMPNTLWTSGYTGSVAPGTLTDLKGGGVNPTGPALPTGNNPNPGPGTGTTGGTGTASGTSSGANPTSSSDESTSGGGQSSGPNGTAIGISLGIIGVAAVGGAAAVFMMKRRRRRHTPLELDGTYVGLDDQWEKPPRPQSPPSMPAPIASGAPIRAPMRPSPFESRPPGSVSGGGSVVGGYDGGQYDQQYDYHGGGGTVVGSNYGDYDGGYGKQQHGGYQGYDQGYPPHGHDQGGYAPHGHDYGYDHPVPTSGPYHGHGGR
ncbi:hypothetical protein BGX23_005869 [Mortierella sp. AD031]|nr:hypothetical protein BGX23_005869 [Mortierella sp. AD031]